MDGEYTIVNGVYKQPYTNMILYINDYTVYCYNMWVNCTYYHNIWVPQSIAFSCLRILRLNYMILYGRYNELVLIGLYKNQIICGGTIQWRVICLVEAGGTYAMISVLVHVQSLHRIPACNTQLQLWPELY